MHPQSTAAPRIHVRSRQSPVKLVELNTPEPGRFPLTSAYGPDGQALRPGAVYIRESEKDQGKWSFETQYEKARDVLLRYGYYVAMVRVDSKTGSKISRAGYQDVALAVQYGLIEAVGVYMMARWGRRVSERMRIGEEFDKLGVDVIDAQRGVPDKPGMIRVVMAGMDEQFLRDLSQKAVDNMPKAARAGKHAAPDPIGYMREVSVLDGEALSRMVEHPAYGPMVREVFRRYDLVAFGGEGESTAQITRWLNRGDLPNPKSSSGRWQRGGIARLLRRRVYRQFGDTHCGEIEWGKVKRGDWLRYAGETIHAQGEHPWLVDGARYDRIQDRLDGSVRMQGVRQVSSGAPLAATVLRCAGCGGTMYYERRGPSQGGRQGHYHCAARHRALSDCRKPSITQRVAEEAVLRELARLRAVAWQPEAFDLAVRRDSHEARRRRLRSEIAAGEADLQANWALYRAMGDLGPESIAAFRRENQAIEQRIRGCKEELETLPKSTLNTVRARELHEELRRTQIADVIAHGQQEGDAEMLREVVETLAQQAQIVERQTMGVGRRTVWACAEVQWTGDVQLLLDAGLLTLGPAAEPPKLPTKREKAAERARRYRARKREQAFPSHVDGIR